MVATANKQEGQAHTFGAQVPAEQKSSHAPAILGQFYELVGVIGEVRGSLLRLHIGGCDGACAAARRKRHGAQSRVSPRPPRASAHNGRKPAFCHPTCHTHPNPHPTYLSWQGTFGRVFLATSKAQPGRRLAVKYIKPGKEQEGVCATALREMMLLKSLSHPNIVTLDSMHMVRPWVWGCRVKGRVAGAGRLMPWLACPDSKRHLGQCLLRRLPCPPCPCPTGREGAVTLLGL